jgi:hypothetical protein
VKDEEEAIAGYEKAAEVVEASDVENKEEILDTLDHIKEEEVEHIEELTDLVDTKDDEIIEVENDPVSNAEDVESEELVEHVNEEHPAIESDQELHGIDNAVVDCKVAKVITHSEDEKPLNCEMKDKPLEKPLTETLEDELKSLDNGDRVVVLDNGGRRLLIDNGGVDFRTEAEWNEFKQLCDEIGLKTTDDVKYFINSLDVKDGDFRRAIKDYRAELGADFAIVNEKLELEHGFSHIKSVAKLVHDEVVKYDKDVVVGTHKSGTAFYVISAKDKSDPKKMKELIIDILAKNHYEPERVEFLEKNSAYGYFIGNIKALATMTMSYQKKESLSENLYNFTEEEMKEFNMDEDGVSLDSYDEYVRCNWCGEVFTVDQCIFEANMGWLCDRCYQAILSRGEKLTIIKNPTDEDIAKTLTEEVKMTAKELKDKFGTDDVDLINAGREPEERVELEEAKITMSKAEMAKLDKEVEEATAEVAKYKIPMKVQVTSAGTTENAPDFGAVPEGQREDAKKAYDRYTKALAARPDRAKNEITYLDEDVEADDTVLSSDPAETPSKKVKAANTSSASGMDFEEACELFGIELEY